MTIYNARTKSCTVVDARETAPTAATENMYTGNGTESQRGEGMLLKTSFRLESGRSTRRAARPLDRISAFWRQTALARPSDSDYSSHGIGLPDLASLCFLPSTVGASRPAGTDHACFHQPSHWQAVRARRTNTNQVKPTLLI